MKLIALASLASVATAFVVPAPVARRSSAIRMAAGKCPRLWGGSSKALYIDIGRSKGRCALIDLGSSVCVDGVNEAWAGSIKWLPCDGTEPLRRSCWIDRSDRSITGAPPQPPLTSAPFIQQTIHRRRQLHRAALRQAADEPGRHAARGRGLRPGGLLQQSPAPVAHRRGGPLPQVVPRGGDRPRPRCHARRARLGLPQYLPLARERRRTWC